jgi:hypothetical protein
MKRGIGFVVFGLLGMAVALAQEGPAERERPRPPMDPMRQMEMQGRQLEMQAREEKMRFQREMDNLQLEERRIELEKQRRALGAGPARPKGKPWRGHACPALGIVLLGGFIVHVLTTIWVYQDIRRRNAGSGIWIVVTLLTGLLGAAVYAFVRLGDKQTA